MIVLVVKFLYRVPNSIYNWLRNVHKKNRIIGVKRVGFQGIIEKYVPGA